MSRAPEHRRHDSKEASEGRTSLSNDGRAPPRVAGPPHTSNRGTRIATSPSHHTPEAGHPCRLESRDKSERGTQSRVPETSRRHASLTLRHSLSEASSIHAATPRQPPVAAPLPARILRSPGQPDPSLPARVSNIGGCRRGEAPPKGPGQELGWSSNPLPRCTGKACRRTEPFPSPRGA
jgi:hypothetical protein